MLKDLPPLKSLLAFSAASRCKNFTLAAEQLFISQSAISHQIKKLEQFLGHKLFYRQGNQLQLTDEGKGFAIIVNQAFEQIASASKVLTGELDNALQFGVASAFAVHRLTPALSELNQRYPELDLRLRMLSCGDSLDTLDLDIILYETHFEQVSYQCERLKLEAYYPVASPLVAAKLADIGIQQWCQVTRLIELQSVDSWIDWRDHHGNDIVIQNQLYFGHTLLMLQAVLAGQGVALLGESLIANELREGTLIKLSDKPMVFGTDGFYFSWHNRRKNDANIRRIKHWLLNLLAPSV